MIIHPVTKTVELGKFLRVWNGRVLLMELEYRLVHGWRDLQEERVINEFNKPVEGELLKMKVVLLF